MVGRLSRVAMPMKEGVKRKDIQTRRFIVVEKDVQSDARGRPRWRDQANGHETCAESAPPVSHGMIL